MVAAKTANLPGEGARVAHGHESFLRQVVGRDIRATCEGMPLADDQQEWFGQQGLDGEAVILDGQGDHGEVEIAFNDGAMEVTAKILPQMNDKVRMGFAATRNQGYQQVRSDRLDCSHCDLAV